MRIIERIWEDIRRGENIDLYVTVIVALGLVILNLIGIAPQSWLGPITLAVLGLLAISTIGNRYYIQKLGQTLTQSADTVFMEEFPASVKSDIEMATELWLVGVTLSRTVKTYYSVIERKLQKGHSIKVLLVHPEGKAIEMAETRMYARADVERTGREILGVIHDLCDLGEVTTGKLEVCTIQNPLTYGAIAVNPESTTGILYLEHYPFKTKDGSKPKFILRTKDGRWYDFFRDELRILFDNSVEWRGKDKD